MGQATEPPDNTMNRGLLTKAERQFLRGEKDDVDAQSYRYNVRRNFRERVAMLEEDLDILREAGEDDLVDEFYSTFGRFQRLESKIDHLERQLEHERNHDTRDRD